MPRRGNGRTRTCLTLCVFDSQLAKCIRRIRPLRLSPTDGSLCVRDALTCFRSSLLCRYHSTVFLFCQALFENFFEKASRNFEKSPCKDGNVMLYYF